MITTAKWNSDLETDRAAVKTALLKHAGHRIVRLESASHAAAERQVRGIGWGVPAGVVRVCQCGYRTRSGVEMAKHLGDAAVSLLLENPIALEADEVPTVEHRLYAKWDQHTYVCACGYAARSLDDLGEHISGLKHNNNMEGGDFYGD